MTGVIWKTEISQWREFMNLNCVGINNQCSIRNLQCSSFGGAFGNGVKRKCRTQMADGGKKRLCHTVESIKVV